MNKIIKKDVNNKGSKTRNISKETKDEL